MDTKHIRCDKAKETRETRNKILESLRKRTSRDRRLNIYNITEFTDLGITRNNIRKYKKAAKELETDELVENLYITLENSIYLRLTSKGLVIANERSSR